MEEAGRRLRLALWQRLAADGRPAAVFLGHHGDDVMEDLVMRLARGANCSGLTGLREERRMGDVRLLRPLLSCRRADIESWLLAQGISDWRSDHSNSDRAYRRNAVRHDLMPRFRHIFGEDQGLQQAARVLRMDADYLEMAAREAYGKLRDLRDWQALHPALRQRVLRMWLDEHAGPGIIPGAALVARLQDACESQRERGGTRYLSVRKGLAIAVSDAGLAVANPAACLSLAAATRAPRWRWRGPLSRLGLAPRTEVPLRQRHGASGDVAAGRRCAESAGQHQRQRGVLCCLGASRRVHGAHLAGWRSHAALCVKSP